MGEMPTPRRWRLHPLLAALVGFLGSLAFLVAGSYVMAVVVEPRAFGDMARLRETYRMLMIESAVFTALAVVLRLLMWVCAGAIASMLASRGRVVAALVAGSPFAIAWVVSLVRRGAGIGDYVLIPIAFVFTWLGHYGVERRRERATPAQADSDAP